MLAKLEARTVPVPAEIRSLERYDDVMAHPGDDVVVAAGAPVGLAGLVRLHPSDVVPGYLGYRTHSKSSATTTNAAATNT